MPANEEAQHNGAATNGAATNGAGTNGAADVPDGGNETASVPLRRHASFLKLWAGQSVSLAGSSVTGLALPLTAIYTLHAGAGEIGLLSAATWLPYVILGLQAGAWTDRHRRRPVLIWADIGRAVLLGGIVALAVTHTLTMPLLYLGVFCTGTLTMFFDVSYNSYVPSIVGRDLLVTANSRLQASSSISNVAGPGLGGLLIQLVTAPIAIIADAASFVVSAAFALWIRTPEPVPPPKRPGESMLKQVRQGLAVCMKNPLLRALMGTATIFNLFAQWMVALLVLFAVRDLGLKAGTIGLAGGLAAIGALIGSVTVTRLSKRFGVGPTTMFAVTIECAVMLAIPFLPGGHPLLATILLAAALAVNGFGTAASSIVATTVRQTITPSRLIGRMTATYKFFTYGVIAIGALLGGLFGQLLGVRHGMLIGAICLMSTVVWTAFSAIPKLRELPTEMAVEAEPPSETGLPGETGLPPAAPGFMPEPESAAVVD
ncbi:MAG TPA: MFS transporter [Streptosporangiaceae bacterium]|nr:MFS transporter [Streptosporangiaceae bacterium]